MTDRTETTDGTIGHTQVFAIKQARDGKVEYFGGFQRSYFFMTLRESSDTSERECGVILYPERRMAERDLRKLRREVGDAKIAEIVPVDLP